MLGEDFHFPVGMDLPVMQAATVELAARWRADGKVEATIVCDEFLQAVAITCEDFAPDDNHFHLAPGRAKTIVFTAREREGTQFKAHVEALNLAASLTVRAQRPAGGAANEAR